MLTPKKRTAKPTNTMPGILALSWQEIRRSKAALLSLIVLVGILLASFIGSAMLDGNYVNRVSIMTVDQSPEQWGRLGTDHGGRDMLSMLFLSARTSFVISFSVTIFSLLIGYIVGIIAGYYGGFVDLVVMRLIDFVFMVPTIMFIIVTVSLIPHYTTTHFVLVLIAFGWPASAVMLRPRVLQEASKDYIAASKTLGTPNWKIILKKILPNTLSFMMVGIVLGLAANIGLETGLSIIGYGLPLGTPSLGGIIRVATNPVVLQHRWWQWLPAVALIFVMTLSIYGVGDAISRAVNPKQRR